MDRVSAKHAEQAGTQIGTQSSPETGLCYEDDEDSELR